jgi:hypothetical protein
MQEPPLWLQQVLVLSPIGFFIVARLTSGGI